MPARKRNKTEVETETPTGTTVESKEIAKIVTEVLLIHENRNDCPVSQAAYAVSVHLATLNVQFEKLLTFKELVNLLDMTKVDTQEHREQIKSSLTILLRSDPHLKFFWSYNVIFRTQWNKVNEISKETQPKSKQTTACYQYMTCICTMHRDKHEHYKSHSFHLAWLVYNHSANQTFKGFLDDHFNYFEGTGIDLGFFDLDEPVDDTRYWDNVTKLITQLYPPMLDQLKTDLPEPLVDRIATIQTMMDNRDEIAILNTQKKELRLKKCELLKQIVQIDIDVTIIKMDILRLANKDGKNLFTLLQTLIAPPTVAPELSSDTSTIKTCDGFKIRIFGNITDNGFKNSISSSSSSVIATTTKERYDLLYPPAESIEDLINDMGYVSKDSSKKRKVPVTMVKVENPAPNPHGKTRASIQELGRCLKSNPVGNSQGVPIQIDSDYDSDNEPVTRLRNKVVKSISEPSSASGKSKESEKSKIVKESEETGEEEERGEQESDRDQDIMESTPESGVDQNLGVNKEREEEVEHLDKQNLIETPKPLKSADGPDGILDPVRDSHTLESDTKIADTQNPVGILNLEVDPKAEDSKSNLDAGESIGNHVTTKNLGGIQNLQESSGNPVGILNLEVDPKAEDSKSNLDAGESIGNHVTTKNLGGIQNLQESSGNPVVEESVGNPAGSVGNPGCVMDSGENSQRVISQESVESKVPGIPTMLPDSVATKVPRIPAAIPDTVATEVSMIPDFPEAVVQLRQLIRNSPMFLVNKILEQPCYHSILTDSPFSQFLAKEYLLRLSLQARSL